MHPVGNASLIPNASYLYQEQQGLLPSMVLVMVGGTSILEGQRMILVLHSKYPDMHLLFSVLILLVLILRTADILNSHRDNVLGLVLIPNGNSNHHNYNHNCSRVEDHQQLTRVNQALNLVHPHQVIDVVNNLTRHLKFLWRLDSQ
jgi:hypothetical protein